MNEFSKRIKMFRNFNDLTQQELADKIGCTKRQVGFWETERSEPSIELILKLASVLNTTTDKLLGYGGSVDVLENEEIAELVKMITSAPADKQAKLIDLCKATIQILL